MTTRLVNGAATERLPHPPASRRTDGAIVFNVALWVPVSLDVCEFPGALVTGMFWAGGNSSDSFPFAADWAIMCSVISSVWKRMMVSRSVHNGLSIVLRLVKFLMIPGSQRIMKWISFTCVSD